MSHQGEPQSMSTPCLRTVLLTVLCGCAAGAPDGAFTDGGTLPDASPDDSTRPDAGGGGGGQGGSTVPGPADAARTDVASSDTGPSSPSMTPDAAVASTAEVCPAGQAWGTPFSGTPRATVVKTGFHFLEGPVWVASQNALFFSDMNFGGGGNAGPPSRMHKLTPPADVVEFVTSAGSNGLAVFDERRLIACTHDTQDLTFFDVVTKQRTPVPGARSFMGKPFNSPNDVTVRADGNIYFTDPDWQQNGRPGQDKQRVYRLAPNGALSVVEEGRTKPNGVALSPDGRTLYVGAIDGAVKKHPVEASGAVGPGQMFAQVSGPDGFGVDCAGNLYVAGGGGVHVFAPDGKRLGMIDGTDGGASNVAFGGADRRTLYITNGKTLYAVRLQIPGYPY